MVTSLLLLAVLFTVGFVNVYFYFSPKKFSAWLQSLFPAVNTSSVSSSKTSGVSSNKTSGTPSDKGRLISESKKAELKRVFATFDKNGDGFITKQELRESLKNLRMFITEKEVEEMVVKVDTNGDGLIDFDEFCILCQGTTGTTMDGSLEQDGSLREINGVGDEEHDEEDTEGELKEAFDVFDKDKDGLISVEELGSVLCSLGLNEGNKMEDCKAMIGKVDMDGDGMVNFDEFKRMMKSGGGLVSVSAS